MAVGAAELRSASVVSTNGIDWTVSSPTGTADILFSVAYGNGVFVATSIASVSLAISADGLTWSPVSSGGMGGYFGITFGSDHFVAVASDILRSTNGTDWLASAFGDSPFYAATYGGGRFVVVGYRGTIAVSDDALTWQRVTSGATDEWFAMTYGNGRFVVPGYFQPVVMTSTNGADWRQHALSKAGQFRSVVWGDAGYVATGNYGTACTSPNGEDWSFQNTGTMKDMMGVTFGQGRYVAVGESGLICTSTNGLNWKSQFVPEVYLYDVIYGGDRFVAAGYNGAVYVSMDGTNWQAGYSGRSERLEALAYGQGLFVAVGNFPNNIIVSSPDGLVWTTRLANMGQDLGAIAFGDGVFMAGRGFLISTNGIDWQSRNSPSGMGIYGLAFGVDTFVAVGSGGGILQSDPLCSLSMEFTTVAELTVRGLSGRSYQIESADDLGITKNWKSATFLTLTNGSQVWRDEGTTNVAKRFYRVRY